MRGPGALASLRALDAPRPPGPWAAGSDKYASAFPEMVAGVADRTRLCGPGHGVAESCRVRRLRMCCRGKGKRGMSVKRLGMTHAET